MRRDGVVVEIRQEQVRRFTDSRRSVYIAGIAGRDRRGAADSCLVIANVVAMLAQGLDEQGCDIGLADVCPRSGDE